MLLPELAAEVGQRARVLAVAGVDKRADRFDQLLHGQPCFLEALLAVLGDGRA
jgi:hypothetical protein